MTKYLIDENVDNDTVDTFEVTINSKILNDIISSNSVNNIEELIDIYNQPLFSDFIKNNFKYVFDGDAFTIKNI